LGIFTGVAKFSGYRYDNNEWTISFGIPQSLKSICLMNLSVAWNRLSARLAKRDMHRMIGRFSTVRKAYSVWQRNVQKTNEAFYRDPLKLRDTSLFGSVSPEELAHELRRRSVAFGLTLPSDLRQEIHQFASENLLYEPEFEGEFRVDEVTRGCLPNGRIVMRGLVKHPQHCGAVERVAQDPTLMAIARQYLGYWPTKVTRHLTWTFVSPLPKAEQRDRFLPLNYHYDVAGYNFMSAYFYITDMDRLSGAHVMIENSHNHKPFYTLFAPCSGLQSDDQVLNYYGQERELLIEGKAGFGFVQDPSCYHKFLSPIKHHRLIFQIRYA